jgi:hypothetical protein
MKINIPDIDTSQFYVNQHIMNGQAIYLVNPKQMGAEWTRDNLHFRSSLWDYDGNLISASFKKFFNFGEKPDLSPLPKNLSGTTIVTKMDGSTCIISKWRGQFIIRTRGSVDVAAQPNASEISLLKQKYPKLFEIDSDKDTWNFSIITEWVTPANQIVIKYNEVDFILIGYINHDDYSLMEQHELDALAIALEMKRPETFTFDSVEDLLANVEKWETREGVVLYCKAGQLLLKIKAAKYLFLHKMKSELSSTEKVMDVWIAQGYPAYIDFYNYILTTFDYELAEYCRGNISNISDGYKEVQKIIEHMKGFVEPLKTLPRKDAALKIIGAYGETNRKSFCFSLLDNRELGGEEIKKLMFQVLKKSP